MLDPPLLASLDVEGGARVPSPSKRRSRLQQPLPQRLTLQMGLINSPLHSTTVPTPFELLLNQPRDLEVEVHGMA